jgi:hypothetical protein
VSNDLWEDGQNRPRLSLQQQCQRKSRTAIVGVAHRTGHLPTSWLLKHSLSAGRRSRGKGRALLKQLIIAIAMACLGFPTARRLFTVVIRMLGLCHV